ncbi:MAG: hypothetical protein ACT4P7_07450 [Gemmatimonadaceae bacterium]
MLAFLDALCTALLHRDEAVIRQLLQHPLAAALPDPVREEARRILDGESRPFAAPLHTLRLYHQTAHLLGVSHDAASRLQNSAGKGPAPGDRARQMELPLPARVA